MATGLFGRRGIVCLFGDSLTELASEDGGWGAQLSHYYARRADVINRGYGRYNTTWALHVMHSLFPKDRLDDSANGKYFLATVWFGANDASIGQNCSVSPEDFEANLISIIENLKLFFHHIVVISPTPVDGESRLKYQRDRYGDNATGVLERTSERAEQYRDIAASVTEKHNVLFLDLLNLMRHVHDDNWCDMLVPDGLHLSCKGQHFVAVQLIRLLEKANIGKNALPIDYFPWDQQSPGDNYVEIMNNYDQNSKGSRIGEGLGMPNFPVMSAPNHTNFEECGITLTDLITLNAYFSHKAEVKIIGFGSLMSEKSARTTFPNLTNFRIVRVEGYRRVFRHPAAIFFERGIANLETLQISSLSAEMHEGSSFIASVFSIEGETGTNFLNREEEFDFHVVPFSMIDQKASATSEVGKGLMCVGGTDDHFISRWGRKVFEDKYLSRGLPGIWNWSPDSGLLPCSVYLRHCYLSAKKLTDTPAIFESFLNDTYLCDRVTTVGEYLSLHPEVLTTLHQKA